MDSNQEAELFRPKVPTSSSPGYFLPVRAPLTHDSGTSSSFTSDSDENSVSEESEGFVSGEEGFETAPETLGGSDNSVSRPFVMNVDEEFENSDEEQEEDYASPRARIEPIVDFGVPILSNFGMPIAQLSADTDDDSVSSVVNEEGDESYFEAVDTDVIEDSVSLGCHKEEGVISGEGGAEDVKYTVGEFEINSIRCDDNDKEVVEDTESGNDNADSAFESDKTNPKIVEVEDKEMDMNIDYEDNEGYAHDLVSYLDGEISDLSQKIDSQIIPDFDDVETNEEVEQTELFESAELDALIRATAGTMFEAMGNSRKSPLERAADLGSIRPNGNHETVQNLSEEDKKRLDKIHQIRAKFLRFVKRIGFSYEDSVVAHVLYRLFVAARVTTSHQELLSNSAEKIVGEVELEGKNDLKLSLNILVIGKSGVGKSATINSIFGEEKVAINAFESETKTIKEIVGTVDGVEIRVLDTPGLKSSLMEQPANKKILSAIGRYTKKWLPDVLLYVDRVDSQTNNLDDLPLFSSITSCLGASIWRKTVVALTHASATPPDERNGSPINHEVLADWRLRVIVGLIEYTVGVRISGLINAVVTIENHHSCEKNGDGELLLPNGEAWRPNLMLLCYATKILSELSHVLEKKKPDLPDRRTRGFRRVVPILSHCLSSLMQSKPHPKLDDMYQEYESLLDSDQENEDEYDQLPPFKPLRKTQIEKLSKEQRNAYFEEYDYRFKLLQMKQLKEMNKNRDKRKEEDVQVIGAPSTVSEMCPDELPLSFDSENGAYRYRYSDFGPHIQTSPIDLGDNLDHDHGFGGVSMSHSSDIANHIPTTICFQIAQDKKCFDMYVDSAVSAQLGKKGSALVLLELKSFGKQPDLSSKTLRLETKFKNLKRNKTTAGLSITSFADNIITGLNIENQLVVGKQLVLSGSAGVVGCGDDMEYGTNLELRIRNEDFLIEPDHGGVSLSLVKTKGKFTWGFNVNSKLRVGRNCEVDLKAGLNNKRKGKISVKTSSSGGLDQLQIAFIGLIAIARVVFLPMFAKPSSRN